jgi:hypothetical protein
MTLLKSTPIWDGRGGGRGLLVITDNAGITPTLCGLLEISLIKAE